MAKTLLNQVLEAIENSDGLSLDNEADRYVLKLKITQIFTRNGRNESNRKKNAQRAAN